MRLQRRHFNFTYTCALNVYTGSTSKEAVLKQKCWNYINPKAKIRLDWIEIKLFTLKAFWN